MLRCKEGELAVVIHDEPGCEVNIGRVVTVSGPIKIHDQFGPTWLIQPTHRAKWAVTTLSGDVVFDRPPLRLVEHPDKWLMPLRPPEPKGTAAAKKEQPATELQGP